MILILCVVPEDVYLHHKDFLIRCANKARILFFVIPHSLEIPYPSLVCHDQAALTYFESIQQLDENQMIALLDLPSSSPRLCVYSVEVGMEMRVDL